MKSFVVILLIVFGSSVALTSSNAYALDKRLKLAFKTGGYGAAAGAVIGAGTWALGLGSFKNTLMGASAGLYAGILLAAYLVATKEDPQKKAIQNPYSPRRPVEGEDYEDEPEDNYRHMLPPETQQSTPKEYQELVLAVPVFSLQF